jgi:tRNA dimethylallyltransferase
MGEGRPTSADELFLSVTLGEEEAGQIGMIDPPSRGGGHHGLGLKRDADAGRGEHRQIIGAVADCHRLFQQDIVFGCESEQGPAFGFAGHDRRPHGAGDPSRGDIEVVGDDMVEAEIGCYPFGEYREPAGNQRRHGAGGSHRRDQRPRAGCQPNSGGRVFEHRILHPSEQADPGFECGGKVDLAIHRAPGYFRDLRPQAEEIREFVEHFVLDNRRLHIRDEKALAPLRQGLDENIDPSAADRGVCRCLDLRRGDRVKDQIAGLTGREPDRLGRGPHRAGDCGSEGHEVRSAAGTGDQSGDNHNGVSSYSDNPARHKRAGGAPPVLIIAGPTASGKSALALELADGLGGTVINADSLQSYRDLRVLTARPDAAAERRVPHRLYGYLDAAERGSAARWRALALDEIAGAISADRLPILVGGTGLYLKALEHGLSPFPEIPDPIRREAIELHRALGGIAFRERLAGLDPVAAQCLFPGDRQRLVRAFEVVRATGVRIGVWRQRSVSRPAYRFTTILLAPPRGRLYPACDARFARMIEAGALAEAAALADRGLDPDLPVMKALGVPELLSHLRGEIRLAEAIAAAQRATRRYAKRQTTWFRHQSTPELILDAQFSESLLRCSRHFIDRFLLTGPA